MRKCAHACNTNIFMSNWLVQFSSHTNDWENAQWRCESPVWSRFVLCSGIFCTWNGNHPVSNICEWPFLGRKTLLGHTKIQNGNTTCTNTKMTMMMMMMITAETRDPPTLPSHPSTIKVELTLDGTECHTLLKGYYTLHTAQDKVKLGSRDTTQCTKHNTDTWHKTLCKKDTTRYMKCIARNTQLTLNTWQGVTLCWKPCCTRLYIAHFWLDGTECHTLRDDTKQQTLHTDAVHAVHAAHDVHYKL